MAKAKKSDFHNITGLKGESPASEGNCAIYQKSPAHHEQRHHQKDPPVTPLVVKGSESVEKRGNFLVQASLSPPRPKDGKFGSDNLVNNDGLLLVLQHIFFAPHNLQQGQMTPIPDFPGSTYSLANCYSRDGSTKHSNVRSKRTKSGKIPSRVLLQNSFRQNVLPTSMQNDSRQDISEVLDDGDTRVNKSVKRNTKKNRKKKGKHSKVFNQQEVCKERQSVPEHSLHVIPTAETVVNSVSCSSDVSENISSHTSISSCLSVKIFNEKTDGEDISFNKHIEYAGSPSPMATSNSDEMIEVEPTVSFPEEFVCDGYHENMTGCMEHSSNQTLSINVEQTSVPSTASNKNIGVSSNQSSSCDDTSCSYYSGQDTTQASYFLLDEWGSDNCSSYNAKGTNLCLKDDDRLNLVDCHIDFPYSRANKLLDVEMPISVSSGGNEKCSLSCGRTGYASVSQACSVSKACTTVSQHGIPGKRGRHGRKSASSCNSTYWSGNQTNPSKVGKDGGHSVWQRVEKKDEGCIPDRNVKASSMESEVHGNSDIIKNKPFLLSQFNGNEDFCNLNEIYSHSDGLTLGCNFDNTDGFHYKSESADISSSLSRRVKKNLSSSLKNDSSRYSRKASHFGRPNTIKHAVVIPRNEAGNPSGLGNEKCEMSDPNSPCRSDNKKSDFIRIEEIDAQSRLEESDSVLANATAMEHLYSNVNGTTDQVGKEQFDPPAREVDTWQRQYRQNVQFEVGNYISYKEDNGGSYQHFANDSTVEKRMDARSSYLETNKHDPSPGAIMQKWVPVGRKDSSLSNKVHHGNLFVTQNLNLQKCDFSNNVHIPNQGFDCGSSLSPAIPLSKCSSSTNTTTVTGSNIDGGGTNRYLPLSCKLDAANDVFNCNARLRTEEVDNFNSETDMQKIVQVVIDACRFQNASELFNLQIGNPVAEFERVLYSASPVISQRHCIIHCKSCGSDQPMGSPLCRHQTPNISIQNIWRWYEKPGSYGLEVKVGYQHIKRYVANQTRFRAYFVPYLSAIQLFGITSGKEVSSCKADKLINASTLNALPIFSVLLPQSDKKLSEPGPDCPSEGKLFDSPLTTIGDHGELLFEYFETDQPQQRRPLFEKINELVRGNISSSNKVFGDPSTLESLSLNDIHPASWFSVAWYPIYRIPDGNFRAAFLTYHSLGTFIQRDAKLISSSSLDIVCPVVGLQSYNAKGECWFRLNESEATMVKSEERLSNPSYILKQRLRSLEQTAAVMARACVSKNGQISVNRQSDYEFFINRRG